MINIHLNMDFAITIQNKYGYWLYAFSGVRKHAYNFGPLHFKVS